MGITVEIKKAFGDFTLNVKFAGQSDRIGILGASGCGKSMTLRCIAGIETPSEGLIIANGRLLFDSRNAVNVRPQKRNVGYLFQNYALFPTMTVRENIRAGIRGSRREKNSRAQEMMEKFQIAPFSNRLPGELSGGQQQRVALARILAYEPEVILLDEPFSALDMYLKDRLQKDMAQMLRDYRGTVILVSHNRDEVYRFSEELLVMEDGRSVIYGGTKEIFENPRHRETAKLTGCKNIAGIERVDGHTAKVRGWGLLLHTEKEIPADASYVGYRAHDFVPVWGNRGRNCIKAVVTHVADLPFERNYYLLPEGGEKADDTGICWFVQRGQLAALEERGMPDYLEIKEEKLMFLK